MRDGGGVNLKTNERYVRICFMKVKEGDVKEFLKRPDTCFKIPNFQRTYSWHIENCKTFLDDFEEAIKLENNHYFGSIFFQPTADADTHIIIDGQQRITTIMLLIIAIYRLIEDNPKLASSTYPSKRIRDEFLENKYAKEDNRIKLRGVIDDDKIFRQIYHQKINEDNKKANLYKNYIYFYENLDKNRLMDYIGGLNRLKIIIIQLNADDDLQKIYESINSTGVSLKAGDKIRNFALMVKDDKTRNWVFENYWTKIEKTLVNTKEGTDNIADFFRKFLTVERNQEIKEGNIYSEFKSFFKEKVVAEEPELIETFYENVLEHLYRYVLLKFNRDERGKYGIFSREVFRINYLKLEVIYPFFMHILKDYDEQKIDKNQVIGLFKVTENYLIRRILSGIQTQGLNKLYTVLHRDIESHLSQSTVSNHLEIYKYILLNKKGGLYFPTTGHIGRHFHDTSINKKYLRFILSSYDDYSQPKESRLLEQISKPKPSLSIEHVMPVKPTDKWKIDLGENHDSIHAQYINSLANLTLTGYNSEYSNKSFREKRDCPQGFSNSPLLINDFIKKQKVWNEYTLKARTEWWLNIIDKVWPIATTNFKPVDKPKDEYRLDELYKGLLTKSKPESIKVGDNYDQAVHDWKSAVGYLLDTVCRNYDEEIGLKMINSPKTTKYVSRHQGDFRLPVEIIETGYYVNTSTSTDYKVQLMKDVVDLADGISQNEIILKVRFRDKT